MKQSILRYIYMSVCLVVLGITLFWLVGHFQTPNLKKVELNKDFEIYMEKDLKAEEIGKERISVDFDVKSGETVYVAYRQGKELAALIKSGKITILNEQREAVFELELPTNGLNKQINLPAGSYTITEESELSNEFMKSFEVLEDFKEEDLEYYFNIWRF